MSFKYMRTQELVTRGLLEDIRVSLHKNWFFWTLVLGRLLRVPWTARRANQSTLKEISPEYSLEGLMLKLKLQYFGHLIRKTNYLKKPWCWERLKVGGKGTTEDEMVGWHHRCDGHEFEETLGVGDGQGSLACCSPWGCKELDTTKQLNWTPHQELSFGKRSDDVNLIYFIVHLTLN